MFYCCACSLQQVMLVKMTLQEVRSSSLCVDQVGSWQKSCKSPLTGPQVLQAKSFEGNATLGRRNRRLSSTSRTTCTRRCESWSSYLFVNVMATNNALQIADIFLTRHLHSIKVITSHSHRNYPVHACTAQGQTFGCVRIHVYLYM